MKRLLWFVYHFPPAGGAGVQRPVKWIKYLRSMGFAATVITVRNGAYWAYDSSLLLDIPPDTHIERTFSLEPALCLPWQRWRQVADKAPSPDSFNWSAKLAPWLKWARTAILPDEQIGWVPFACWAAWRALGQRAHHGIVSTSGPFSAHLAAMAMQRSSKLPWLADFRDSWSRDPMQLLRHHRCHRWLESLVARRATYCSGATLGIVRDLQQHLPKQASPNARCIHLPNGYDPADFPAQSTGTNQHEQRRHQALRLTFVGTIYGKLNLLPVLEALALLKTTEVCPAAEKEASSSSKPSIILQLIGQRDSLARQSIAAAIERLQLAPYVSCQGYLPHSSAIWQMQQASVLLLLLYTGPGSEQIMTGKIYEYLAANRPILALVPTGEAQALLERSQRACIVPPDDVQAIVAALRSYQRLHQQGLLYRSPAPLPADWQRYNRQHTAQRIGQLWQPSNTSSTVFPA